MKICLSIKKQRGNTVKVLVKNAHCLLFYTKIMSSVQGYGQDKALCTANISKQVNMKFTLPSMVSKYIGK